VRVSHRTHFTPKGVSIRAAPVAINMQPLRGCWLPVGAPRIVPQTGQSMEHHREERRSRALLPRSTAFVIVFRRRDGC
jgi:hypothetical protein